MESLKSKPKPWDELPCPYCGGTVVYVDNETVYGKRYGNGKMYLCKCCGASVGVHGDRDGRATRNPLGMLATPEMKRLKQKCHFNFDSVWKSHKLSRNQCYQRLANLMNIEARYCHFGYFNKADLIRALQIMQDYAWYETEAKK